MVESGVSSTMIVSQDKHEVSIDLGELEEEIFETDDNKLRDYRDALKDKGRSIAEEISLLVNSRLESAKQKLEDVRSLRSHLNWVDLQGTPDAMKDILEGSLKSESNPDGLLTGDIHQYYWRNQPVIAFINEACMKTEQVCLKRIDDLEYGIPKDLFG